jgi:hypothetical protein
MFNSPYKTELPENLESTTLADFFSQFEQDLFAKTVKRIIYCYEQTAEEIKEYIETKALLFDVWQDEDDS